MPDIAILPGYSCTTTTKVSKSFKAWRKRCGISGLELKDDYIKWCISDEAHNESYVRAIEKFLKGIPKCTAIVCCNYIIYRLVIKTLQKMGKTVSEGLFAGLF